MGRLITGLTSLEREIEFLKIICCISFLLLVLSESYPSVISLTTNTPPSPQKHIWMQQHIAVQIVLRMHLLWVNRLSNRRALYMRPHSCCALVDCLSIQWTSLSVSLSLSLSPSHTLTGYPVWVSPHVIRINCGISRTAPFFHIRLLRLCLQKCFFFYSLFCTPVMLSHVNHPQQDGTEHL